MPKETLICNLYGGPSTGKSSMMAGLFAELKWRGLDCEQAPEFAKEKVWEESYRVLENQIYVFGKQLHSLHRLIGKVDCVVTDSPILLSLVYGKNMPSSFHSLVLDMFRSHNTLNVFLVRNDWKNYNPNGRMQTHDEACLIDETLKGLLIKHAIDFVDVFSHPSSVKNIADMIRDRIGIDKFVYGVEK